MLKNHTEKYSVKFARKFIQNPVFVPTTSLKVGKFALPYLILIHCFETASDANVKIEQILSNFAIFEVKQNLDFSVSTKSK